MYAATWTEYSLPRETAAFGAFAGSTRVGLESLASVGGFGRWAGTTVFGVGEGVTIGGDDVATAGGFSVGAATTGFAGVEVVPDAFADVELALDVVGVKGAGVVEAFTEAVGGLAGALIVAGVTAVTAATNGQR